MHKMYLLNSITRTKGLMLSSSGSTCSSVKLLRTLFITSGSEIGSKNSSNILRHYKFSRPISILTTPPLASTTLLMCQCHSKLLNPNGTRISSVYQQLDKRWLKTSPPLRAAIPPFILVILGRVGKLLAVLIGRRFRLWFRKLPEEERAKYTQKVTKNRYILSGILGALAFGSFVYYESHVQETPFTKRKRFLAFTDQQFDEMSKFELEMMLRTYKDKIIPARMSIPSYRRVVQVAQRLLKANQDLPHIRGKEWSITVIDEDEHANAFVLPCGSIFVFSGLLKLCESDDELGIILGHELAHCVMSHGPEKASLLHVLDLLMILPLAALWSILPTDVIAAFGHFVTATVTTIVMELPHSRFIEHEADQVGLVLASKACFDVRQCLVLWEKMGMISSVKGMEDINLEFLSTHPSHDKRQKELEELLPAALDLREKCFCPRLPLYDPKAEILKFEKKLKQQEQHPHAGLLMPVKIN